MRQSTSITGCVRRLVCRLVCQSVTHSFDDPHVAPYRPTWPCSLRLALSVNAGNSPNRRDCHCRYSLFCGHSSSLGKLFLQFHGVVLNQTWVSNALLWLHHDAIAHDLIHGWGTEACGLIISASHFTGIFHSYLLPLFHKETRSPKLGQQSMWSPELAGTQASRH